MPGQKVAGTVDEECGIDVRRDEIVISVLCARGDTAWSSGWLFGKTLDSTDVFLLFFRGQSAPGRALASKWYHGNIMVGEDRHAPLFSNSRVLQGASRRWIRILRVIFPEIPVPGN